MATSRAATTGCAAGRPSSRPPAASGCRQEITRIQAYKRDCYIVDVICLGISTDAREVEVNEEMEAWTALHASLASRCGIGQDDWFVGVAVPAFATNQTTLWPRDAKRP
jgi:hypothetical protein